MDLKEIQNLIKFVAKSGASEVSLETEEFKITVKTGGETVYAQAPIATMAQPMQHAMPTAAPTAPASAPAAAAEPADENANYITVKSPMIGTFYRKSSPDKPAFIEVGQDINPGDVTCIIEAMKLFNEIESEVSGKIVKILVDDSTPVEYDQPLYLVDPS